MRSDDLYQLLRDAVVRRDKPAAEAALAALRAYADQLQASSDEAATAEALRGICEAEEHLRLEALFESDPVAYWQHVAATLRTEREARMRAAAIASSDTDPPGVS